MSDLNDMVRKRASGRSDLYALRQQSANKQAGVADNAVWLALDSIIVDEAIQVRQAGLDPERVSQYALAMVEYGGWGTFPPLDVFRDPETDELYLAGGFHRRAAVDASQQTRVEDDKYPIEEAPCVVHPGGREAAIEFAEDDNLTHGLNLTNKDKRAIFKRRLVEGHVWAQYSNRRIAAELGVDEGTVRNWRKKLESGAENSAGETTIRIGQDGKAYDVGGDSGGSEESPYPGKSKRCFRRPHEYNGE